MPKVNGDCVRTEERIPKIIAFTVLKCKKTLLSWMRKANPRREYYGENNKALVIDKPKGKNQVKETFHRAF